MEEPTHYFWKITDEVSGKRRETRYRMTEQEAQDRHGADAVKVEGSGVAYRSLGHTSDFLKREP